jgi:ABC-2 type transport system ATP-binding protein
MKCRNLLYEHIEHGADAAEAAVEVQHLTKHYGPVAAVDDLSLRIRRGCIFGLVGPNGAGKSTTLGCLTGLLDPTAGSIQLLGEEFTSRSVSLKRRIGVMPDPVALFDQLYAWEFLAFHARIFGLAEATTRERVAELLEILDLEDAAVPLEEFSTGMRKKAAFAAAVIHRPELLVLDEPFSGIDPGSTAMVKDWLRHFADEGRTVLLTSHALDTVERLCDEVAIIHEGRLAWRADLRTSPAGSPISYAGEQYASLELLFLKIVGGQTRRPAWL